MDHLDGLSLIFLGVVLLGILIGDARARRKARLTEEALEDGATIRPFEFECDGCHCKALGQELRTPDMHAVAVGWLALPVGWFLRETDAAAGMQSTVCSLPCARRVETIDRARELNGSGEDPEGVAAAAAVTTRKWT